MTAASQPVPFRRSIAFRYLLVACSALFVAQLALGALQIRQIYAQQRQALEDSMNTQSRFLSAVSPEPVLRLDFLSLENLISQTSANPDVVYAVAVGANDQPLTRFVNRSHPLVAALPPTLDVLGIATQLRDQSAIREIRQPIVSAGRTLGEIRLGYSLERTQRSSFEAALATFVGAVAISLLLAALTFGLFTRWVRRPIQRLADLAQAIEQGALGERAAVRRADEVGQLGRSLNAMAGQLQVTMASLEQQVEARTSQLSEALEQQRVQSEALGQSLQAQRELDRLVAELAVPVIPVADDVLVVPLIGNLDQQRAGQIQSSILANLVRHRARAVILDVTGISVLDTAIAQVLLQTARAAQLLGVQPIMVGIRPEVAQTMVSLGIDFEQLETQATLQEGLRSLGFAPDQRASGARTRAGSGWGGA